MEIWKTIPQYSNYEVSNLGRVKTKYRVFIRTNGSKITIKEKIKKQIIDNKGYKRVTLSVNNKSKSMLVHQLVAMAFLKHIPCGHEKVIDHKDENKSNNKLSNLQILTNRKNCNKSMNTSKQTSKYIGVCLHKGTGKYHANIRDGKKRYFLGQFDTEIEAKKHYDKALKQILNNKKVEVKRDSSSKYKGVSLQKRTNDKSKWRYVAYIADSKKHIHIGSYKTEHEAYKARKEYIKRIHKAISK